MTGTLRETHLHDLRQQSTPDQSSLFDYSNNEENDTKIAVVSDPNDTGILEHTDEHMPELGMPRWKLDEFRKIRSGFNEVDPVKAHNRAYTRLDLDDVFESHVEHHTEAKSSIEEIVKRLREGENITLVCFEGKKKNCHRHKLKEIIEEKL